MRILVVTAVPAERDAVLSAFTAGGERAEHSVLPGGLRPHRVRSGEVVLDVLAAGVGPAAAASATATALTAAALAGPGAAPDAPSPYALAVSAGIGGGFVRPAETDGAAHAGSAPLGSVVVSDALVAADLGAQTPEGFLPVTALGFGRDAHHPPAGLAEAVAAASGARTGTVLTGSTVTGSAERAAELAGRHPRALAEGMEGFGVAEAAAAHGVPVLEVRAVSNLVGPRDRAAWRIGEALRALTHTFAALPAALTTWRTP